MLATRPERVGLPYRPNPRRAQSTGRSGASIREIRPPVDNDSSETRPPLPQFQSTTASNDRGRSKVSQPYYATRSPSSPPTSTIPDTTHEIPPSLPTLDVSSDILGRMKSRKANTESVGERNIRSDGDDSAVGPGQSLWDRVRSVADSLTINVSRAWETQMSTYSGEATPPGKDSRLTCAMKAYHISKARDISDLPTWLFDERDQWSVNRPSSPSHKLPVDNQPRTLRDIYSSVAKEQREKQAMTQTAGSSANSRAADRLKAMRPKPAKGLTVAPAATVATNDIEKLDRGNAVVNDGTVKIRLGVGLPSRPGIYRS